MELILLARIHSKNSPIAANFARTILSGNRIPLRADLPLTKWSCPMQERTAHSVSVASLVRNAWSFRVIMSANRIAWAKLVDFLPFTCAGCGLQFCQEHSARTAHSCAHVAKDTNIVAVCSSCKRGIPLGGKSEQDALSLHLRSCSAAQSSQKQKTQRAKEKEKLARLGVDSCIYPGCKGKELTPVYCRNCNQLVCLKHRFPADHFCAKEPGISKVEKKDRKSKYKLQVAKAFPTQGGSSSSKKNKDGCVVM